MRSTASFGRMRRIDAVAAVLLAVAVAGCAMHSAAADQRTEAFVRTIAGPLNASGGISVDDRFVYVADYGPDLYRAGGQVVYRMSWDGGDIGVHGDGFGGASGNALSRDGILHQADIALGRVVRVEPGIPAIEVGRGLESPVGIAIAGSGSVYVVECRANAVSRVADDGSIVRIAQGAPLNCPNGLALGGDGALYSSNFRDGNVVRIALQDGAMRVHATVPGGGNGHVDAHWPLLYVASFRGNRIYSVDRSGAVALVAGSGAAGNVDGPARRAAFFRPNGIAVAPGGRVLFVNTTARLVAAHSTELQPNLVRAIFLDGECLSLPGIRCAQGRDVSR